MNEETISFETAKLAKEKGFPQLNQGLYFTKDEGHCLVGWGFNDRTEDSFAQYSAPSQTILKRWLREIHNLVVEPSYDFIVSGGWNCAVIEGKLNGMYYPTDAVQVESYEEALEIGLVAALKLIE